MRAYVHSKGWIGLDDEALAIRCLMDPHHDHLQLGSAGGSAPATLRCPLCRGAVPQPIELSSQDLGRALGAEILPALIHDMRGSVAPLLNHVVLFEMFGLPTDNETSDRTVQSMGRKLRALI